MKQIVALFLLAMSLYYIYLVQVVREAVRVLQTGSLEGKEIILLAVTIYLGVKCWRQRRSYQVIGMADDFTPALKTALTHNQLNYCEQPGIIKVPALPGAIGYQSKGSKKETLFNFKGSFSTTTIINVLEQLEKYFTTHPFTTNKKAMFC